MYRIITVAAIGVALVAGTALGQEENQRNGFRVNLDGYQEVIPVATTGAGRFELKVAPDGESLEYTLRYSGLVGNVLQAHIHFGRPAINGGIMVFLCSNVGSPAPTPACPGPNSGEVSGTLDADDVIGPLGQGIAAGEFSDVVDVIRSSSGYVNVHTSVYPGGEIRGNIR